MKIEKIQPTFTQKEHLKSTAVAFGIWTVLSALAFVYIHIEFLVKDHFQIVWKK
jgi:hypothetical protein